MRRTDDQNIHRGRGTGCLDRWGDEEGVVTGYKVLLKNEQVATLEYRSHTWIGAIVKDINIITKRDQSVMRVAGWIIHELKG